ncbi:branched-chain amino acid ABC transporter substrate-binding protein [Piscinibacter sp. HJYY11]|uniref:branched-chain amino acid ABC transporter substrate-binding protein n=1 Tax=Piscinibacter sp. HJYY11 TaxID=2801333 RepID=UPI00191F6986|nr:branched-chain amino acid ABC transporter substrate-binding protein [Piscinibacter sp. HJYY11]MBL0726644.1 branched-chain amino acid ABC transporter substrate-binding protein [Piscinibacter sp. HJYY11]
MPRFRPALLFASFACAFLLVGCNRIPDTVKIGVAQPMSGPLAALGHDMKNGVQLAIDELNAQGFKIDGKPVKLELVAVDDKSNADEGVRVAESLVEAGVVAVVGHLNSGVSMAAAPVYAKNDIAQLAISTKPEYTQLGHSTTLRLVSNDALQSKALGSYAATLAGASKFAVVDDNTPYGKGLADLAAAEIKKAGKPVALRKSLDDKTTDFNTLVPELKAAGVDVFVTTLADFQVGALIEQLVKAELTSMVVIGGDIKTPKMAQAAMGVRGVYATSPIADAIEFPSGRPFLDKFNSAFKGNPVYGAHYAYDATYVLAAAMRRAGSVDPKKLTAQLKVIDALAPVTNNMRFREDGEQKYGAVGVYKVTRGAWETVTRSADW